MTREIKFRAWGDVSKKMSYGWGCYTDENEHSWLITDVDSVGNCNGNKVSKLMQSTGLIVGEKELYEGDILMYPDTESEYVDVGIGEVKVAEQQLNSFWPVEFCEGEFGMNIKDGELMYGASDKNPQWISLKRFFEDYISADKCEIIGNIHENSELIQ